MDFTFSKPFKMPHGVNLIKSPERSFMSDLKLICSDGEQFDVHKAIVCSRSDFFEAACTVDMKEKSEGVIHLSETSDVVRSLIEWCYSDRYFPPSGNDCVYDVKIYKAADKYQMKGLSDFARKNFDSRVDRLLGVYRGWSPDNLRVEDKDLNTPGFKAGLQQLFETIDHIYSDSDDWAPELRRSLIRQIAWYPQLINSHRDLWQEFIRQKPDYIADLLEHLLQCIGQADPESQYGPKAAANMVIVPRTR